MSTKQQILWACRRGMLELDLILMPFATHEYEGLTSEDQQLFQAFLKESDQDLFGWLMQSAVPENPDYQSMVEKILSAILQQK